jgi:hypothetical protein
MSAPSERPMNRRTRPLTGSTQVDRQARRVVKADGGAVEGQRRLTLTRLSATGHDPNVLHCSAAQHPPKMQLARHPDRLPLDTDAAPVQAPRTDESAEEAKLFRIRTGRAGRVQRLNELITPWGLTDVH